MHGDEDLLVEVYGRLQRQSWARWRAKVPDLLSLLDESIPVIIASVQQCHLDSTSVFQRKEEKENDSAHAVLRNDSFT